MLQKILQAQRLPIGFWSDHYIAEKLRMFYFTAREISFRKTQKSFDPESREILLLDTQCRNI